MPSFPIKPGSPASHPFLRPRFQTGVVPTEDGSLEIQPLTALAEPTVPERQLDIPSLVSSAHGRIERVLFTLPFWLFVRQDEAKPEDFPAVNACAVAIRNLIRLLPESTKLLFLVHQHFKDDEFDFEPLLRLQKWLACMGIAPERFQIVAADQTMKFTVWAEDAYAVSYDRQDGDVFLVEPRSFNRSNDGRIADALTKDESTDLHLSSVPLIYQGGNILIGDEFWFLGKDYLNDSIRLKLIAPNPPETVELRAMKKYSEALDRDRVLIAIGSRKPVPGFPDGKVVQTFENQGVQWTQEIYRGNLELTVQPIFHIDMFLTTAGRDTNGKYIVLVGDPKLAADLTGQPLPPHSLAYAFDDIAEQLADHGFSVIRNPLPLTYDDDKVNRLRRWYFATSNNALVEIVGEQKRVWLPTYGHRDWLELEVTDNYNKKLWEDLGFEVTDLGDFHGFAVALGAAHCVKKYVARGDPQAASA